MGYILYAFNILLVAVVLGGIMLWIYDKTRINPAFLPLLSVSLITTLVYLGGLVGLLAPITLLIYLVGLTAAVYECIRILRKKYFPIDFFTSPGIWIFLFFCIFFIFRMEGMQVLHVDNFSHWAVIIKDMCLTDGFPEQSTPITFLNYTPGSATFIYFVCKAVTFTEGHALMAQGIITSAALATLFCKVKFGNVVSILGLISVSVLAVSILELQSASLSIYNFLVDDLLAYITVSAGIIIYAYRRDVKKCLMTLIPVIGMLVIIKNSARIFAALVTVFVVIVFAKVIFSKKNFVAFLFLLAVEFLLPTFYNIYSNLTFPKHTDKFSSSLGDLFSTFTSKDPAYLKDIASKMMTQLTDLSSVSIKLIITAEIFALTVLIVFLILKKKPHIILPALICANLTLIFYIGELFVLYGFIFNQTEADTLASFYRYFATGTILVVLTLLTASVYQLGNLANRYQSKKIVTIAFSVMMLFFTITPLHTARECTIQLINPLYRKETVTRLQLRKHFTDFYSEVSPNVPANSYVLVYTENRKFFTALLPMYELMTNHFEMMYPADFQNPSSVLKELELREYVVVDGDLEFFKKNIRLLNYTLIGGDSAVYKINADAKTIVAVGNK